MATTRSKSALDVLLDASRTFFHHKSDQLRAAKARRAVYRNTFSELSSLTDRDLRDLGIPRASIKRLAQEAANGI